MLANDSYDDVIVKFNVSTQENVSTFNVITFKNADYVVLKGIKFISSPGSSLWRALHTYMCRIVISGQL